MASVYARNGMLYIQYMYEGKNIQRSTKLGDNPINRKIVTKQMLPDMERKIVMGELESHTKTLEDYVTIYLERKGTKGFKTFHKMCARAKTVSTYFHKKKICDIKVSEIERFLFSLNITIDSTKEYKTILIGAFQIAFKDNAINTNPMLKVEQGIGLQQKVVDSDPFTPAEVKVILENAEGWLKNYLAISFYTGMRTGEALGLMITDILTDSIFIRHNMVGGLLSTPKTKNSVREIPLFEVLRPYIDSQIKEAISEKRERLFEVSSSIKIYNGTRFSPWSRLLVKCSLAHRKLYITRHTFITTMLSSGNYSILQIAKIAGHVNTEMIVKNYAKYIRGEQLKIDRSTDIFL
ncbi:MAG: tyrosine-type recombinase/integrase, partial [Sulfuricurvum sp.]|nr:tyrosine-type recombinase/integrase [Sulfuricurvum sp.]